MTEQRKPDSEISLAGLEARFRRDLQLLTLPPTKDWVEPRVHPQYGSVLDVAIPPGTNDGQVLRLRGKGRPGLNGGPPGDALVEIAVRPHPYFRREGDNIHLDLPVSLAEAVLGAKVDVPTISGETLTITVKPGTSSGARLRLRGKGIAGGDEYVVIKVVVPAPADDRSRELIEEFVRRNPQNPRADVPWR